MKEINTEIEILSTPDEVWQILMELPNWSKWNPIVNKIEGDLKIGGELSITMSNSKGDNGKKYKSIIVELDENKRFSFIATMMAKFMFSAERIIELRATEKGTIFIQREIYTGLMVSLFWKKLSTDATEMLNSMNKALKKEVEK
ncbi:MAG: SRPBCC domain-containing protein [Flavobacteriales bacterium]|nr:SRPBCC domain-containing protein [Flavobacteriales bacterium]